MLRHPLAVSSPDDLTSGSFLDIIDSTNSSPAKVKKIVLSTGKIYYDIIEKLDKDRSDIALIRVEQIYPLNTELLEKLFSKYSSAKEILWVQEEPKNMGAWSFIAPRISEILNGQKLSYCGRKESAATATGSLKMHMQEQKEIIDSALKAI
jgi:2-oxoglutarate dehydrogenase E1 component